MSPGDPRSRYLIIADTDPRLDATLGRAADGGALVVRRPGPVLPPHSGGDTELTTALDLVLGADGHVEIALCGQTQAPGDGRTGWADDCGESGVGFLIRVRARKAAARRESDRRRAALLALAVNLWTYTRVERAWSLGRLRVAAWFVSAEGRVVQEIVPPHEVLSPARSDEPVVSPSSHSE